MNISICITTLNEEGSIGKLLDSLLLQSKKPDEIIIVDGGSTDRTVEIIHHYQKKDARIKLLTEKCSRARGRNLGIEIAKNSIIAITDAGCVAHKDWLKNLTAPFDEAKIDVSAGFYKMVGKNSLQKAMSVYLGVTPRNFDVGFLPSARSMAFRKNVWEAVGGFPENLKGAAEDTVFDLKLVKNKAKIARVKNAIVEWGMPTSITKYQLSIFNYAKGDAKSKIWIYPKNVGMSHNVKALLVLLRYLIGLLLLILSFKYSLLPYLIILFLLYLVWSFRKVFLEFGDLGIALWGPVLQITSDIAVIYGFVSGILGGNGLF